MLSVKWRLFGLGLNVLNLVNLSDFWVASFCNSFRWRTQRSAMLRDSIIEVSYWTQPATTCPRRQSSALWYIFTLPWWRHQMETFSALLVICTGNSPVTSEFPDKGQWGGALMFSLICAWINGWVNNCVPGDLSRDRAHYDVTVMIIFTHLLLYWGVSQYKDVVLPV